MSVENLLKTYVRADDIDRREGAQAYGRYHELMRKIAKKYNMPLHRVVAAFVALSPNSDYVGNVRSLVSLLEGLRQGRDVADITVSTYRHCLLRAHMYATGEEDFLYHAKGPKIRAFYHNVLYPEQDEHVTVDGHMYGVWMGESGDSLTMKEAKLTARVYTEIEDGVKLIAQAVGLLPHQVQATLWFTRKRLLKVKYNPQMDIFNAMDDKWGTMLRLEDIRVY